ncbi:FabD/lysophospholipase-like protein [Mycena venus]|uniref:FabD/lysophospholipase-like protein n=1 Tax=Mycena venus TaxID=2733690 RepID=A0A8H6YPG0_9AGAR|nr:FabD/lysophospholipase-like protein [Mycena venus]
MLGRGTRMLINYISGGQGGSGGRSHGQGTGGHGGDGQGPTVHQHYNIKTKHFTVNNLHARSAAVQASQMVNHCPPPSRIFQGRRNILDKMYHFFTSNRGIQHIYVLHGLGGAGKTQIALKFIKESSSCFSDIFFIDTSTIATIDTGLKNIAVAKEFGDSPQDGLLWLTSNIEEWLLFFDNADDPSINLNDFIPQCNHGNIIITTRNPRLRVYAGSHSHVSDMEVEDAVALLLKSAAKEATTSTEQTATEIVKALHYLPLAIVQAGAFISKSQDLNSYLALYTKNQAKLLRKKPSQSHDCYAWTVYTTWQMSFAQLTPLAAMFLQHCSFLHHNGISEDIFHHASMYIFPPNGLSKEELQEPLEFLSHFLEPTGEWDSLLFLDVTNEVQAYSLVNFDAEKKLFSIHPLVHAWCRTTVHNPQRYMSTIGSILGMAILERPRQNLQLATLVLCPHVEFAVQMNAEVALVFMHQYISIFWEAGKYKQNEKLIEEVLVKQKQLLGDNHPDTLLIMGSLARTYSDLGEHQKAKELNVIVLEKQQQLLCDNHLVTLHTMGSLASAYSGLGEYRKAEELQVIVLGKQKQLLGDNHLDTLHTMGSLALTYSDLGEHQKAQELKVIVLEKQKQLLDDNHPDTLLTMGSLARTYFDLGEHQKAKELNVIVLEKLQQLLGDNNPYTLLVMGNLARAYSGLREHQKAKELEVIVLEKQKQILGDNHPKTLHIMGNLASTYSNLGEHQKAKELEIIVLEKEKQVLGDNHPDTLRTMAILANTYSALGEHQKAKELKIIVLEKQKQVLGDNHPDTLRTMAILANTYSALGEHQKAKELNVIVLEKRKQILGDNHPDTLRTMGNLANTYSALGEHQKAKELKVIVLKKQKQLLGDNHPDTLHTIDNLAIIQSKLRS